jgi:hypothetical protein
LFSNFNHKDNGDFYSVFRTLLLRVVALPQRLSAISCSSQILFDYKIIGYRKYSIGIIQCCGIDKSIAHLMIYLHNNTIKTQMISSTGNFMQIKKNAATQPDELAEPDGDNNCQ